MLLLASFVGVASQACKLHSWGVDTGLLAGSDWGDMKTKAPTQLGFMHRAAGKHCKLRRAWHTMP